MNVVALDTNVLLRLANRTASEHAVCVAAVKDLRAEGITLALPTQVLVEFWVVATRPASVNGLGWTIERTAESVEAFGRHFDILHEDETTVARWKDMVIRGRIAGKRGHDARIAAVLASAGVRRLLTLNMSDFEGLLSIDPIHPESALS